MALQIGHLGHFFPFVSLSRARESIPCDRGTIEKKCPKCPKRQCTINRLKKQLRERFPEAHRETKR